MADEASEISMWSDGEDVFVDISVSDSIDAFSSSLACEFPSSSNLSQLSIFACVSQTGCRLPYRLQTSFRRPLASTSSCVTFCASHIFTDLSRCYGTSFEAAQLRCALARGMPKL